MAKHRRSAAAREATRGNSNSESGGKRDRSPFVPQRDKLDFDLSIQQKHPLRPRQQELLDLMLHKDTRVVFLSGPAGTSKSYLAVLAGLMSMQRGGISDIAYIRSVIESASKSMGFLPGESGSKFEPYLRPLRDKLEEFLPMPQVERLVKEERASGIPVGFLRGASFNARFLLLDEAQNLTPPELLTVLTRVGQFTKLIVAGDPSQSDIAGRSGFQRTLDLFNDEESRANGIHCFGFTAEDIVRSPLVQFVVKRFEQQAGAADKHEPMFPPPTPNR